MTDRTFLDSLSPDAVANVLRMFSDQPYAKFRKNGVRFDCLFRLYIGEGALAETCWMSFPVISNLTRMQKFYGEKSEDHLRIFSDKYMLAAALQAGGPIFTGVSLRV